MRTADEESCDTNESRAPGPLSCHASTPGLVVFVPEFICRQKRKSMLANENEQRFRIFGGKICTLGIQKYFFLARDVETPSPTAYLRAITLKGEPPHSKHVTTGVGIQQRCHVDTLLGVRLSSFHHELNKRQGPFWRNLAMVPERLALTTTLFLLIFLGAEKTAVCLRPT